MKDGAALRVLKRLARWHFDANLGLMRVSYAEGHYGDAFLHIGSTNNLAQTDQQKALVLYWTGLIQEKRNDVQDAITAWESLLAMPPDAMTSQMRADATGHLAALATPGVGTQPVVPSGSTSTPPPPASRTPAATATP